MLRFNLAVTGFCLPVIACGGNVALDNNNSNTVGGSGASGASAIPVGTAGSDSGLPSGLSLVTPDQWTQILNDACTGFSMESELSWNLVGFIVDTSSSMNETAPNTYGRTKWQVVRDVLSTYISSTPNSFAVSLTAYPNEPTGPNIGLTPLSIDACVNTSASVPIQIDGNVPLTRRDAITNTLLNATPQGGRPTQDAYAYTLSNLLLPIMSDIQAASPYLVLITDGQPNLAAGCQGVGNDQNPVDIDPLIQAISSAYSQYSIRTLVIGLPGSERGTSTEVAGRVVLSQAAQAGQTMLSSGCNDTGIPSYCHIDLTQDLDLQSSLQEKLQSAFGVAVSGLSCSYRLPPPPSGQTPDLSKISVAYTSSYQKPAKYLVVQTDPTCPRGDGWYLAADNQIELCARTCSTIQQDPTASIEVVQACFQNITVDN